MSSQFHNRLVGTVVLVALGVIFLPDILDGKKDRQEEQFSEIPLRPTVIEQQKADDDMFEVLSAEDAAALNGTEVALAEMPVNADNEKSAVAPVIEVAKYSECNEQHQAIDHKEILKRQKPRWIVSVFARWRKYRKMAAHQQQQCCRIDASIPYAPHGLGDTREQTRAFGCHGRDDRTPVCRRRKREGNRLLYPLHL